jgi:hypothetical protein
LWITRFQFSQRGLCGQPESFSVIADKASVATSQGGRGSDRTALRTVVVRYRNRGEQMKLDDLESHLAIVTAGGVRVSGQP